MKVNRNNHMLKKPTFASPFVSTKAFKDSKYLYIYLSNHFIQLLVNKNILAFKYKVTILLKQWQKAIETLHLIELSIYMEHNYIYDCINFCLKQSICNRSTVTKRQYVDINVTVYNANIQFKHTNAPLANRIHPHSSSPLLSMYIDFPQNSCFVKKKTSPADFSAKICN